MRQSQIIVLLTLVLTGCASAQLTPAGELQGPVPVLRIIDGDTVELPFGQTTESVRLIGIDTPETYPETESYGPEASAFTEALLNVQEVYVEIGVGERDRYRRVLAYLYFEDSGGDWQRCGFNFRQVNLEIVRAGLTDPLAIPPNIQYSELYRQAAQEARAAACGPTKNHDGTFRQRRRR